MNRRTFLKSLLAIGGIGTLSGLYAWQIEPFLLEFVEKEMPIKNLPEHLTGKTLMQISDIHIGNRFDYNYIIDGFKKAQNYNPDFVVYTGDYVTYENKKQLKQLREVMRYAVYGKIATAGILGNHDYGHNWREPELANEITGYLKSIGIHILRNEQHCFDGLNVIGFDDYWGPNFNPADALKNYNANGANVLLCHNPDVCDLDVWQQYQGWILAGHTHGGQVKPPFLPAPMLPVKNKRYAAGEIDLGDGRRLYINRAIGCLWQIRFNVRPEITLFKLKQA